MQLPSMHLKPGMSKTVTFLLCGFCQLDCFPMSPRLSLSTLRKYNAFMDTGENEEKEEKEKGKKGEKNKRKEKTENNIILE